MATYQNIFQQTSSRAESPAKVFAKLKSKVGREASCGKDGVYTRKDLLGKVKEKHGAEFMSPRKRTNPHWTPDELDENRGFGFVCEAQALTISPMSSPQRNFGYSHEDWSSKLAEDAVGERRHGCTPRKGGFLESSVRSQPFHIASRTQSLAEAAQVRDGFDVIHRTQQQKIQAAENEFLQEVRVPLTASPSVFSPMRSKLRKRTLQSSGLHNESSPLAELQTFKGLPTRRFDKSQTMFPAQTRKISSLLWLHILQLLIISIELTGGSDSNRRQRRRGQSSPDVSSQDVCLHEGEGKQTRAARRLQTRRFEEPLWQQSQYVYKFLTFHF